MVINNIVTHPPYLKRGSVIGITCPAGSVSQERVSFAVEVLKLWGFEVRLGKTVGSEHHYFSGTDGQRLADHILRTFLLLQLPEGRRSWLEAVECQVRVDRQRFMRPLPPVAADIEHHPRF